MAKAAAELVLFGIKGENARTLAAGRRLATRKREHSRKPVPPDPL